jgi:hypothetical protein
MTLLNALASPAIPKLSDFKRQEISNTAWAIAKLEYRDIPLLQSISASAITNMSG